MEVKIISKKSKKPRQSGHYWVKWAGISGLTNIPEAWRVAAYGEGIGWKLAGDERLYYDQDFVAINENRISPLGGFIVSKYVFWTIVIGTAINVAITIYYILIHK
jgi:hypothetical protein